MGFRQYLLCGAPALLDSLLGVPQFGRALVDAGVSCRDPAVPATPGPWGGHISAGCVPRGGDCPGPAWLTALGVPRGGQVPHRDLQGCHPLPPSPAKEAEQLTELRARHGFSCGFMQLMEPGKF